MDNHRNWAGNYEYHAKELVAPGSIEQLQEIVAHAKRVKVLGTRHSFNGIADSTGTHVSLDKLNRVIELDRVRHTVTVEAGIRYGDLCGQLQREGYALHNLASLPHITIAGACATATHGSGDRNGNLATAVRAIELVKADGELVRYSRDEDRYGTFAGAVVHLGALGVVTRLTLDVVPTFELAQTVYEGLSLGQLQEHMEAIFSSAYSVSLFTDWKQAAFNQVWLKHRVDADSAPVQVEPTFYGAKPANEHRHPVPGHSAENCSPQLGIPGPWQERLPHFRMEFTPSAGDELQSEYFVARTDAYAALCAIERLRQAIAPHLHVSEIRTIAADNLWMSPCYKQDSVALHFTWKSNGEAVRQLLPRMEEQLAPYQARPHWGKLFAMAPARLRSLYAKLPDFQQLILQHDPNGKFRNAFLDEFVRG